MEEWTLKHKHAYELVIHCNIDQLELRKRLINYCMIQTAINLILRIVNKIPSNILLLLCKQQNIKLRIELESYSHNRVYKIKNQGFIIC